MLNWFLGALIVALFLTVAFSYGYERERRFSGLGLFFILLFLPLLAFSLWIPRYGPIFLGVAWLPLFFLGILVLALIAGTTPTSYYVRRKRLKEFPREGFSADDEQDWQRSINAFFVVFFVVFLVAILAGLLSSPPAW